jgi:hypothetical protein
MRQNCRMIVPGWGNDCCESYSNSSALRAQSVKRIEKLKISSQETRELSAKGNSSYVVVLGQKPCSCPKRGSESPYIHAARPDPGSSPGYDISHVSYLRMENYLGFGEARRLLSP